MTNPYASGVPAHPSRSRSGAVLMMVLGGIAMILGPIIGLMISAFTILGEIDLDQLSGQPTISNPGTTTVLDAGQWSVVSSGGSTGSCTVSTANGADVDLTTTFGVIPEFTASGSDTYTVECTEGDRLYVVPTSTIDFIGDNLGGIAGPVMIGFGLGFLGFVSLVIGIIWFVIRGRQNREAELRSYDAGGGGYGGGYGGHGYGGGGSYGGGSHGGGGGGYPNDASRGYGTGADQSPGFDNPYADPPRYGQNPEEPPRYGERL